MRTLSASLFALALIACQASDAPSAMPGDSEDMQPYAGIGESEIVRFTGTEPFWGGQVTGGTLIYSTPDNQNGATIAVDRFAGRNGVSWSGILDGEPITLALTPGACSDGMSDRRYPFVATLAVSDEHREGCAWTDDLPFSSPDNP